MTVANESYFFVLASILYWRLAKLSSEIFHQIQTMDQLRQFARFNRLKVDRKLQYNDLSKDLERQVRDKATDMNIALSPFPLSFWQMETICIDWESEQRKPKPKQDEDGWTQV